MYLEFESPKISLMHPLRSQTCLFWPIKLNSLLCFELLFHKPLKNDILAQRSTSNSSSSEIFPLVTICLASFFETSSLTHKSRCQFRVHVQSIWIRKWPIWFVLHCPCRYRVVSRRKQNEDREKNDEQQLFVPHKISRETRALAKTCCRGGSAPWYEPSGTVYSAASPFRANMRIPGRPYPIVLSPSLSLSFSHRQPVFRFRFRTGSQSIKIIFTCFAAMRSAV